ncbi:hypothetical protein [Novosphingobium rosa]|uniref:hypothetical protein n=1 Tax=Novosphingobium rosa TaxID=76978 RepID=UPI00082FB433|nr:hypothetical protein [Novosphingobium rosa]
MSVLSAFRTLTHYGIRAGAPLALLLLAGCGNDAIPVDSSDTSADVGMTTTGTFQCRSGRPWQAVQVSNSVDVPAGGTARVSVETPPHPVTPNSAGPERAILYCKVDNSWCSGTSCHGNPPVDFIAKNGDGLSWQSVRAENGDVKSVYTATVHNSDREAHQATLILDMGAPTS